MTNLFGSSYCTHKGSSGYYYECENNFFFCSGVATCADIGCSHQDGTKHYGCSIHGNMVNGEGTITCSFSGY